MSATVTIAAIWIVRQATSRKTGVSMIRWKFSSVKVVDDVARERVGVPDRREQQDEERPEVDDDEPPDRERQQRGEANPRMAIEERGKPPPRTLPGRRLDNGD